MFKPPTHNICCVNAAIKSKASSPIFSLEPSSSLKMSCSSSVYVYFPSSSASYNITVKTGDQKGSGTDANVYIILHGQGFQTKECKLDNFFKNDFERGEIDKFSIDSEVNISEVQRIELRRDNCGLYSNWYLDWIEVTNKKNSITFVFPAMKWIKANDRYFFNHVTCLPQDDLFLETRKLELQAIQAEYQLQVKIPGLPAQVKKLPEDEKFSFHYKANFALEGITLKGESFKLMLINKNEWEDVEDVKTVYTKAFGVPKVYTYSVNRYLFSCHHH
ncbi:ALOX5 [Mytilus coruscus]|uniref:ALOX5 n=1 Tax=Mytilus coruscus TaxID=42192 RepID=A0A6J8AHV4_MYTCO|nr:ALOX5 [Mytilus coruscus]